MSVRTIVSCDPGKNNFAFAVSRIDKTGKKYQVVETGMVQNTVVDLTSDVKSQCDRFYKEVRSLVLKNKSDILVAERFMVRGRFMGGSAELINVMIGRLTSLKVQQRYITAAQWKNQFNKIYKLDDLYKEIPMVPHRIDATLIGIYGSHYFTNTKPFEELDVNKLRKQLIKTI